MVQLTWCLLCAEDLATKLEGGGDPIPERVRGELSLTQTMGVEGRLEELEEKLAKREEEMVRVFLKANGFKGKAGDGGKPPVNGRKSSGLTGATYPLHVAVKQGDATMAELLLAHGADALQKDSSGKTPRGLAEKMAKKAEKKKDGQAPRAQAVLSALTPRDEPAPSSDTS